MKNQSFRNLILHSRHLQQGAMMVEFLVVAGAVLISLFLLIPTLAKMMDIRHETEQAGQYAIWEKTIWHRDGNQAGSYDNNSSAKAKTDNDLVKEAYRRVLSQPNALIKSNASSKETETDSFHYFVDSKTGTAVYSKLLGKRGDTSSPLKIRSITNNEQAPGSNDKPQFSVSKEKAIDRYKIENTQAKFNTSGYFVNEASVLVKQPSWYKEFSDNITMTTQKAILSDGWGAGGRKHNENIVNRLQSDGFAKTGVFGTAPTLDLSFEVDVYGVDIKLAEFSVELPDLSFGPSRKTFIKEWTNAYKYLPEIGRDLDDLDPDFVESDLLLTPDGHKNDKGETVGEQLGTY